MKTQEEKRKKGKAGAPFGAPASAGKVHAYAKKIAFSPLFANKLRAAISFLTALCLAVCFVMGTMCAFSSLEEVLAKYLQANSEKFPYFELWLSASEEDELFKRYDYLQKNTEQYSSGTVDGGWACFDMDAERLSSFGFEPVGDVLPLSEGVFYHSLGKDDRLETYTGRRIRCSTLLFSEEVLEGGLRDYWILNNEDFVFGGQVVAKGCNDPRLQTEDVVIVDGEEIPYWEYMQENGLVWQDLVGLPFKLYSVFLPQYFVSARIHAYQGGSDDMILFKDRIAFGFIGEEALLAAKAQVPVLTLGGLVRTGFTSNRISSYTEAIDEFPREDYILSAETPQVKELLLEGQGALRTVVRTESVKDLPALFVALEYDLSGTDNLILIDAEGGYGSGFYHNGFENDDTSLVWNLKQMAQPLDTMRNVGLGASGVLAVLYMVMTSLTFASSFKKRKREFALMQAVGVPRRKVFLYCLAALGVFAGVILAAGIVAAWPLEQLLRVFVHMEWQGTVMTLVTLSGEAFGVLAALVVVTALPAALLAAKSIYGGSVADRLREE